MATNADLNEINVVFHLRDRNAGMVEAWRDAFQEYMNFDICVSHGDIFVDAPAADALVSPANSFGFMDGGIDAVYTRHFGIQLQERLQEAIRTEYDGELLVGQAKIIPTFGTEENLNAQDWTKYNEGQPIRYLVSAPTMRVPCRVHESVNAFLAFRAVIIAVRKHNMENKMRPIRSVLCPGLGTAVGEMSHSKCAYQMLHAYQAYELGLHRPVLLNPSSLVDVWTDHDHMICQR